jgi:hypothetical protein
MPHLLQPENTVYASRFKIQMTHYFVGFDYLQLLGYLEGTNCSASSEESIPNFTGEMFEAKKP